VKLDKTKVYRLTRQVPAGRVTTYGALAKAAGNPKATRGIGMLMHVNPDAPRTPCHRVVMSNGKVGGYGSKKGVSQKIERLKAEGVNVINGKVVNFDRKLFTEFEIETD